MPLVVSVDMGYGHLRAALPIAEALGVPVAFADRPPLADEDETARWRSTRVFYEGLTRLSQRRFGFPLRPFVSSITSLPGGLWGPRLLARMIGQGLGRGVVEAARAQPMVTTFYAPAIAADRAGIPSACVVTDVDVNRVWAPLETARTRIRYLVPQERTARRLSSFGIPAERIAVTGFPLPPRLIASAHQTLEARLARLEKAREGKGPLSLVFSVGGAGAQAGTACRIVRHLEAQVRSGEIRVTLSAGVRQEVANRMRREMEKAGLAGPGVTILHFPDVPTYLKEFEALIPEADLLWTKPSELSFWAALGLPLLLAAPVGAHEAANRELLREAGAALEAGPSRKAAEWLPTLLREGTIAAAARAGFDRLPREGLERIVETTRLL